MLRRSWASIDGSQHLDSQPGSTCDEWFGEHGFRVLRFRNDDVLLRTQDVLSAILRTLSADMTQRLGYFSVDTSSTCG
ncbi:MAG: DUF559 domain-containing protein [Dokdonella sp.]